MLDSQGKVDGIYSRPPGPVIQIRTENHLFPGQPQRPKKKRRFFKRLLWFFVLLFLIFGTYVGVKTSMLSSKVFVGEKGSFFKQVKDILRGATSSLTLQGEKEGQINMLLLGIGGEGHDGPYLSDSILLAQIKPASKQISLVSIPRDYLVTLPGYGDRKINAAFAEGYYKTKDWDLAGALARQVVGEIAGVRIPYFAVVDFRGFEKAIDQIGGVTIEVERTFTDNKYPDKNNGYLPPVTFNQGTEHMNGERALIFARSRHAAGEEGSDFARSQRQHKIIQATKEKAISLNLVSDIGTVNSLVNVFAEHFHTNVSAGEMLRLYNLTKDFSRDNLVTASLDPATNLVCPDIVESTGAYVIVPCGGVSIQAIKDFFKNSFVIGKMAAEKSVVWIATDNPTGRAYKQTERKLTAYGVTVWPITYTEISPERTVIYTVNEKPATVEFIKNILDSREVSVAPPGIKIDANRSDIILILGNNIILDPLPPPPALKPQLPPPPPTPKPQDTAPEETSPPPPKTPPPPAKKPKP